MRGQFKTRSVFNRSGAGLKRTHITLHHKCVNPKPGKGFSFDLFELFANTRVPPEKRLLIAIFDRALRDFLAPDMATGREHIRSGKQYFYTAESRDYGTLGHFCEEMDIDPNYVLERVFSDDMEERLKGLLRRGSGKKESE